MAIDFLPKASKFLGPPVDEVALHEAALVALAEGDGELADTIAGAEPDLATCILYNYVLQSKHQAFIRTIDQLPTRVLHGSKQVKLLIVPGMFYAEYPDVGADGLLARDIFERNGFDAELVYVNSRGGVAENKKIIADAIARQDQRDLWLVSISKGSADLRACLQEIPASEFPSKIKGWVNFSGIYAGSVLADHRSDTRFKRLFLRTVCRLTGVNYELVRELSTSHYYWQQAADFSEKLKLIHVVGFPLKSHVQPLLAHRFSKLSKSGPTDGMVRLLDTVNYPGHVYPVWGCDHFARTHGISALLYRLCHYISESTEDV